MSGTPWKLVDVWVPLDVVVEFMFENWTQVGAPADVEELVPQISPLIPNAPEYEIVAEAEKLVAAIADADGKLQTLSELLPKKVEETK